jgi:hypothetical protein
MNIFVLDEDPVVAASYHCDKHVCKMILESAQMLCDAHIVHDGFKKAQKRVPLLLRATHINHPCAIWARQHVTNYEWLRALLGGLLDEYTFRYLKLHSYMTLHEQLGNRPMNIDDGDSPFVQVMPPQYMGPDTVKAYRDYYWHEKRQFAKWKMENVPEWWMAYQEDMEVAHG